MRIMNHVDANRWSLASMMSFVDFTVFNSSAAEFTNINAGGVDVPAGQSLTATLTGAELLVVAALNGAVVMQTAPTAVEIRAAAKILVVASNLDDNVTELIRADDSGIELHKAAARVAYAAV